MENVTLIELLAQLRAGVINSIEFGNPEMPLGVMSHHRIVRIPTAGGMQFAFKHVRRSMLGSGIYMGDCDDAAILAYSEKTISDYTRPSPNPAVRAFMESRKAKSAPLVYFAIAHDHPAAA